MLDINKLRNTPVTITIEADMFTLFLTSLVLHSGLREPSTKPVEVDSHQGKFTIPPLQMTDPAREAVHAMANLFFNEVIEFYIDQRKNGAPN